MNRHCLSYLPLPPWENVFFASSYFFQIQPTPPRSPTTATNTTLKTCMRNCLFVANELTVMSSLSCIYENHWKNVKLFERTRNHSWQYHIDGPLSFLQDRPHYNIVNVKPAKTKTTDQWSVVSDQDHILSLSSLPF